MTTGLGFLNNATHSVTERQDSFNYTVALALKHPFIGVGLGGVGPSIANTLFPGITYDDYVGHKIEGISVFVEVFAATGIIGGIALLVYFVKQYQFLFWRNVEDSDLYKVVLALGAGLLAELALLVAEQNILRTYLW